MKITMTSALLLVLPSLLGLACGTSSGEGDGESSSETVASPSKALEPEIDVEARERAAFDSGLAAEGEAFLQPVSPELQRELEAGYQQNSGSGIREEQSSSAHRASQ